MLDPFDDFYAALGRATLNIAISGIIEFENGRGSLAVDKVGFYIRDSYEFLDNQFLGFWNRHGVTRLPGPNIAAIPINKDTGGRESEEIVIPTVVSRPLNIEFDRYYSVTNSSFRDFQDLGHGGDFTIFSDVIILPMLNGPVRIEL